MNNFNNFDSFGDNLANLAIFLQNLSLETKSSAKKQRSRSRSRKNKKSSSQRTPTHEVQLLEKEVASLSPKQLSSNPLLRAIELAGTPRPRSLPQPRQLVANPSFLLLSGQMPMSPAGEVVYYEDILPDTKKFQTIKSRFPPSLSVLNVKEVHNPYLKMSFEIARHFRYLDRKPEELFHGTKLKYVHNICNFNFDWRFNGAERGHKFGKGVNFTPKPQFAANFCDRTESKVAILTDVLICNKTIGNNSLELPPDGYDTTIRPDGKTFVKFSDAEFCPRYVIFFSKN